MVERAPEKREVTGSTPVPTTGKFHYRDHFDGQSVWEPRFRALRVPSRNWNEFQIELSPSRLTARLVKGKPEA